MKKFTIVLVILSILYLIYDYLFMYKGDIYIPKFAEIETISYIEGEKLYDKNNKELKIKGIKMSSSAPENDGEKDNSISKETYFRWIKKISDTGANVISVEEVQPPEFYEALYDYNVSNKNNEVYLIQGISANENLYLEEMDVFNKELIKDMEVAYKVTINAIHGNLKSGKFTSGFHEKYKFDVSKWVYSYVIYANWEQDIIKYTNNRKETEQYKGKYLYTENATSFEIFLATIGDRIINYETSKYKQQRNISFTIYSDTDPLPYPEKIKYFSENYAEINIENIFETDSYKSGVYVSYNIYPYSPEYYDDGTGSKNLYREYVKMLNDFHKKPVVISEYGVPSSRGIAAYERNRKLARDYGGLTEVEQGNAIISMYKDIMEMGSVGCILNNWQDEWSNKSWNTIPTVDLERNIYWSDYQTNEQFFGLMAFDPGEKEPISYNDADKSEWKEKDIVLKNNKYNLSMKYDEKYIYYMVDCKGRNPKNEKLFIPIDTTSKSGSKHISNFNIKLDKNADFVICIEGEKKSKLLVQERYNTIDGVYGKFIKNNYNQFIEKPEKNSNKFVDIKALLYEKDYYCESKKISQKEFIDRNRYHSKYYSLFKTNTTGILVYGNGNPKSKDFDSLSDFYYGKDFVEIRIPWQLLNFYDPSQMKIHDDYYECYGVEPITIDKMYVGVGNEGSNIGMKEFKLEGWGNDVTYHERLKKSYYILKNYWDSEEKTN